MSAYDSRRPYDTMIRSVCGVCPAGCGVKLFVQAGQVVDLLGDELHPVNRGAVCARGSAAFQHFGHPARLGQAAARQTPGQDYVARSWEEALDFTADRLKSILEQHGPDSVVVAAPGTLEAGDRVGAARLAEGLGARLIAGLSPIPADLDPAHIFPPSQWQRAGCFLIVGGDPAIDYPLAFRSVMEASARRAPVIAAAARFTSTLSKAEFALQIRPGSEAVFLMALARVLVEEQAPEADAAGELPNEAAWLEAVKSLSWEGIEDLTWLLEASIRRAALSWASNQPGVLIFGGTASPELTRAANWLLALTNRRVGGRRPGLTAGWDWLSEPAWPPLGTRESRPVGSQPVRAVIGSGDYWPRLENSLDLSQAELVVHFGAYPGLTYRRANVSFPAAGWGEREGLWISHDCRIQRSLQAIPAPESTSSALEFWTGLAGRLAVDRGFPWKSADGKVNSDAFIDSLLSETPALAEIDRSAIDQPGRAIWYTPDRSALAPTVDLGIPPDFDAPHPSERQPLLLHRDTLPEGDSAWWSWLHPGGDTASFYLNPTLARALEVQNNEILVVDDGQRQVAGRAALTNALPASVIWASAGPPETVPVMAYPKQGSPQRALARLHVLLTHIQG